MITYRDLMHRISEMTTEERDCVAVAQFDVDGETIYKAVTLDTYRGSTFGGMIQENYPVLKLDSGR